MRDNETRNWQDWGITVLRVAVGSIFLMHGGQKLFVYGIGGVAGVFTKLGIPAPMLSAVLATAAEFLGGLALLAGFRTRWAAAPLAVTMLVATLAVSAKSGFFLPGAEYTLTLLAATMTLMLADSGRASVDGLLAGRRRRRGEA